jgi:hypothetical protein
MTRVQSRWLGVLATVAAVSIAAAIFLPPIHPGLHQAQMISCAGNLSQLYKIGEIYASTHNGQWPAAKGSALWLEFTKTNPPLIAPDELEVLLCPVKGEPVLGHCDFLGPSRPYSELKPGDALAADRPGNHVDERSGNVLLKDGRVQEYEFTHPIWKTLSD